MASSFTAVAHKVFGSKNDRELKRLRPMVAAINELEPQISAESDDRLRERIAEWKAKLSAIEEDEELAEAMDEVLPEVFAVVREAARRTLGQRHFDVQLIGGMVLHRGKIAEMKTGEGKTLVATLPAVLNALTGRGVHIVTVNDYLARRDAEWMGRIYTFLGLTVGVVVHGVSDPERKAAYACDITYGQNNEFGFDYLRDNMKFNLEDYVQRAHNFAIVDEVDSILIDEARTPLIISGASEESTDTYYVVDRVIPRLKLEDHYTIDEKLRTVALTEEGVTKVEQLLGIDNLYDPRNILLVHHVNQGLKAHTLFKRDVEYVVKDGQVVIVDEFTGRLMPGRRWSDGLHQAVEAKEGVKIESENQTLATITFQNYFRMYEQAGRDDRHRRHRGGRVQGNLRPRRGGHADQPADDPHRQSRRHLQDRGRKVRRGDRGDPGLPRTRPAGAGRHRVDREVRAGRQSAQEDLGQAFRAQRQEP